MRRPFLLAALLALAACAPTPQQVAARCERETRPDTAVTGEVRLGYASDRGFVSGQEIGFTAGVSLGGSRGSRAAYEACLRARGGLGAS
jgi:hypothetical protein